MTIEVSRRVVSRCLQRPVLTSGRWLLQCALAKLAYLLGKGLDSETVRELISQPIRGELTPTRPILGELTGPDSSRIRSLFDRLSLLSLGGQRPEATVDTSTSLYRVGGEALSDVDVANLEETLYPVLISVAAAKSDNSLKVLLDSLLTDDNGNKQATIAPTGIPNRNSESTGLSLLNKFTTLSPLHVACLHGNLQNVKLLLQHGASVHLRDVQGHTALFHACSTREGTTSIKTDIVTLLKNAGAHLSPAELEAGPSTLLDDQEIWQLACGSQP